MWLYFAKDYASCVIIEPNKDSLLHVAPRYKGTKIREFKVIDGIFLFMLLVLHLTPPPPISVTTRPLWCVDGKSEFYYILPQPEKWSYT